MTAATFASGEGRRLLIVDDDEAVLKALGDYFERLGYAVVRAATGRQGIAAYQAQEPDVVVLDLKLPDLDGLQVLEALRQFRAVVIMLTGYGDIPTAVRAMQLGAENFLTKPVDLPHLVAAVERGLEKRDLRRENIRLRALVPTTGRRLMQAAVVAALVAGAMLLGRAIGGLDTEENRPTPIAPRQDPRPSGPERRIDSLLRLPSPVPDTTPPVRPGG
jgi:FixJ family two-component response regulator